MSTISTCLKILQAEYYCRMLWPTKKRHWGEKSTSTTLSPSAFGSSKFAHHHHIYHHHHHHGGPLWKRGLRAPRLSSIYNLSWSGRQRWERERGKWEKGGGHVNNLVKREGEPQVNRGEACQLLFSTLKQSFRESLKNRFGFSLLTFTSGWEVESTY